VRFFELEELVDEQTFKKYGSACWQFFDPKALEMLDNVREFLNVPLIVNNWHSGGDFQFRGYRPVWCGVGAPQSAHKRGRAFDFDAKGMTAEEVRQDIIREQNNPLLTGIQRMEADVGWIHIDNAEVPKNKERIYLFHA
jgi:hypothetical protein